ncbi:hypothetical protein IM876_09165 [Serratia plymuthica]|uniref:hypothetical protein n=1 Tax=Serratia plymuthica TaxID=82996 RepID=UPI001925DCE5|nr:hypothetical protein [Serratia plymuthica]MBL3522832.1 hypothetical protein [Serratia plymuthica]
MATKKPEYSAKVKFWLPTYSGDFEGGMYGCTVELFGMLPVAQQEKALEKMTAKLMKAKADASGQEKQ